MAKKITLFEMGPRDGLQNEKNHLDVQSRIEMVQRLAMAGLRKIEIGAFVRDDKVPQMAGSLEVVKGVLDLQARGKIPKDVEFSALVPNEKGFAEALRAGLKEVAIFAACSESFSRKNINCSIEESFQRFGPVIALARKNKIKVRGYLSVCFGCPFEGEVPEKRVLQLTERMLQMGVYEVSVGDTIGVAHMGQIESFFKKTKAKGLQKKIAGHFHDTRGQALANIQKAHQLGVTTFDSSIAGLGGCPYAPGATGNVATEELVYMFEGMKNSTNVNLKQLMAVLPWLEQKVGHPPASRLGKAGL